MSNINRQPTGLDIIIEGNIGADKAILVSLLRHILQDYFESIKEYQEPSDGWTNLKQNTPLLKKVEQHKDIYGFSFQIMAINALAKTYQQQQDATLRIFNRSMYGTMAFNSLYFYDNIITFHQYKLLGDYIKTFESMFKNRQKYCYLLLPSTNMCFGHLKFRPNIKRLLGDDKSILWKLESLQEMINITFVEPDFDMEQVIKLDHFCEIPNYSDSFSTIIDTCFLIFNDIINFTNNTALRDAVIYHPELLKKKIIKFLIQHLQDITVEDQYLDYYYDSDYETDSE